jgi:hypothetical protein
LVTSTSARLRPPFVAAHMLFSLELTRNRVELLRT